MEKLTIISGIIAVGTADMEDVIRLPFLSKRNTNTRH